MKTTSWSDVGPKSMTSIRLSIDCLMTKKGRVLFFSLEATDILFHWIIFFHSLDSIQCNATDLSSCRCRCRTAGHGNSFSFSLSLSLWEPTGWRAFRIWRRRRREKKTKKRKMKRKKADEIDNRRPARPPWHSAMNQNGGGSDVKRE